jgi:hypothetical protein
MVKGIFGNCHFPNDYYVRMACGGAARLARNIPLPHKLTGWIMGRMREGLLLAEKMPS